MKDKTTALILSALVGWLGVDRFYLGYYGMGVLKLLTGGCFGVLWILDIIGIATGNLMPADGSVYSENTISVSSKENRKLMKDPYEELQQIAKLKEQGILSEEEFKKLKATCLSRIK